MSEGLVGVVGVALRGFAIGKGGKAQSWERSSGDGGCESSGAVALLGGIKKGGWQGLLVDSGERLRELIEVPLGASRSARKYDRSEEDQ